MRPQLLLSPPAAGKTQACIDRLRQVMNARPFCLAWVIVGGRSQATAFQRRLAASGGVLGARVATFQDFYLEILERSGRQVPLAENAMLHRMTVQLIGELRAAGHLPYFEPISAKPGFAPVLRDRIGELKRALVQPERLLNLARRSNQAGLMDLGTIYSEYQARLQSLGWADADGLGWLAVEALQADPQLLRDWSFLAVDGLDEFNPGQIKLLGEASCRIGECLITLTGADRMERIAHRRFQPAWAGLMSEMEIEVTTLSGLVHLPAVLRTLEEGLFEPARNLTPQSGTVHGADLSAADSPVKLLEARSPSEEAREALRWIKARVVRDGLAPGRCGLAVAEFGPYRDALRAGAAEFGITLRFSQGALLAALPCAAALWNLISLVPNGFELRPLLDIVRSPFFNLNQCGLNRKDAKPLEIASRYGQVTGGIDQWEQTLIRLGSTSCADDADQAELEETGAPQLPVGPHAQRLWVGLRSLFDRLNPPAEPMTLRLWAAWLDELLADLGFFECGFTADEEPEVDALLSLMGGLARSEMLTGESAVDRAGFLAEVDGLLNSTTLREPDFDAEDCVQVFSLERVCGLRFDALAVLGLAEGSFPAIEREDPFLNDTVRTSLGMKPRLGQAQAGLFYTAVTRADRFLLLSRAYLAKDGETWEASPYWGAGLAVLDAPIQRIRPEDARPLAEAASESELLFWSARRKAYAGGSPGAQAGLDWHYPAGTGLNIRWEQICQNQRVLSERLARTGRSIFNGDLESLSGEFQQRYGLSAVWNTSRFESYATCPFGFLARYGLGLQVLQTPQPGYQADQLGSILHAVLEEVYTASPDPTDTVDVLNRLTPIAAQVFARAPEEQDFRPSPLWEIQQAELLVKLQRAIEGIASLDEGAGWRPLVFEASFGFSGQPYLSLAVEGEVVHLRGTIDRVDINPSGCIRIIDYKSGRSHLTAQDLVDGRRLQLPLYALAAREALGLGEPVEGLYWALMAGEPGSLRLSRFVSSESGCGVEAAFETARQQVSRIVCGIRAGQFGPVSPSGGCPAYCSAAAWCWQFRPAR